MSQNIEMQYLNSSGQYVKIVPHTIASDNSCFLSTETAGLYGLDGNATPEDVLKQINYNFYIIKLGCNFCTLTVTYSDGVPATNILVNGFINTDMEPIEVYTNEAGVASGYVKAETAILSISGYADIEDNSIALTEAAGNMLQKTLVITPLNFLLISETSDYKFSPRTYRVDSTTVGGGGNGGKGGNSAYSTDIYGGTGGGGGGGGYVIVTENIPFNHNTTYPAIIGAINGASSFLGIEADGGNNGSNGVTNYGIAISGTSGGTGGTTGGGGAGRNSNGGTWPGGNGVDGTIGYSSFTETTIYGSSGGGGGTYGTSGSTAGGAGGAGAGSGGAGQLYSPGSKGADATNFGAGGGGGGGAGVWTQSGGGYAGGEAGAGKQGCIAIRMWLTDYDNGGAA